MPFFQLKQDLAKEVAKLLALPGVTAESLEADMGVPPQLELGHVALPCYKFSKILRQPTDQIAKKIAADLKTPGVTSAAAGPYVNFKWSVDLLANHTLEAIAKEKGKYGGDQSGEQKKVLIEYCSPNTAKKLGFAHIRSTLIGNTLANVYDALGFKTIRMNFVGDWGSQFAKLLAAFERWGDPAILTAGDPAAAMDHLFQIYVRYHKEIDPTPEAGAIASKALQKLEDHEPQTTALWKQIRDVSIKTVEATVARLHVRFDRVEGESDYIAGMAEKLEEVKQRAGAKLSDGAWIVEVPGVSTPALIQKKDGTTLYLTRDIAAAEDRWRRFKFDKMFYVVSEQQKLHFQLLFGTLKLMGCEWADRCEHLSFGTVLFGAEKMSTREGRVIFLDELLEEAKERALEEVTKKNPGLASKEQVAETVGIGAVIFGSLSNHKKTDIEFNWDRVITLDGETGPYVQYSAVRCHSLLSKAAEKGEWDFKNPGFTPPANYEYALEEEALILELAKMRSTLHSVVRDNEPYHLAHAAIDLAKAFNRFYYKLPVLQSSNPEQRRLRLALVAATHQVLTNELGLLGIDTPSEM